MKPLVGLLRDKTPKFADGTIGSDIPRMVKTFGRGMFVDVTKPKPQLGESEQEVMEPFCRKGRESIDSSSNASEKRQLAEKGFRRVRFY